MKHALSFALGASLSMGACAGASDPLGDDLGYAGTGIAVTVAPLELPGVTDACYSFEINNFQGQRVVARGGPQDAGGVGVAGQGGDGGPAWDAGTPPSLQSPLCSNRFGNSQGAISYVAPCDASPGTESHTVTLWVNSVCEAGTGFLGLDDGGTCVPLTGFVNPCGPTGCSVTATCVENADVPISFNFTIMASARQGFFDMAVNFDNVFCSAKLDTCYQDDSFINLLHDEDGVRQHTAVAAVACSAGPGNDTQTTLYFTTFQVECGDPDEPTTYTLDLADVSIEGRLHPDNGSTLTAFDASLDEIGTLPAAVYFGTEDLSAPDGQGGTIAQNKVYTNIAFLVPEEFAATGCTVTWTVYPTDDDPNDPDAGPPGSEDPPPGTYTQVASVDFDGLVQYGVCHRHPFFQAQVRPTGGVSAAYQSLAGVREGVRELTGERTATGDLGTGGLIGSRLGSCASDADCGPHQDCVSRTLTLLCPFDDPDCQPEEQVVSACAPRECDPGAADIGDACDPDGALAARGFDVDCASSFAIVVDRFGNAHTEGPVPTPIESTGDCAETCERGEVCADGSCEDTTCSESEYCQDIWGDDAECVVSSYSLGGTTGVCQRMVEPPSFCQAPEYDMMVRERMVRLRLSQISTTYRTAIARISAGDPSGFAAVDYRVSAVIGDRQELPRAGFPDGSADMPESP